MRLSSMIFVLVLSSASLAAQTAANNPAVLIKPPAAQACPVQLSVDREPVGALIPTNGSSAPHGQGLSLTFAKLQEQIVSADILVHFYPSGAHAIPAAPPTAKGVPPTESFHLTATAANPMLHSSIWTKHTAVVSWVELTRLEYADGTTWQASTPRQCGAAPNLYVLVDSAP
jgi:hypothetical protein